MTAPPDAWNRKTSAVHPTGRWAKLLGGFFVSSSVLRQDNTQHLLLGPKAAPEFSLRRRGHSPRSWPWGNCMGETLLLLSCGVAFLTGLGIAAVSLFS
jgi:hypothetical protein